MAAGSPQVPRILFLHYGEAWIRGSERCLLDLLARLDRSRFDPLVACNQRPMREAVERLGIPCFETPFPEIMIDRSHVRLELGRYLSALRAILRFARSSPGGPPTGLYCNSGLGAQIGFGVSKVLRVPRLCHLHAPFDRRYYALWTLWDAQEIVFVSEATRRVSLAKLRYRGRVTVVHNGVDLERFAPVKDRDPLIRARLGLPPATPVIGQIGSLIERKGGDVLLRAFRELRARRPAKLVLVGEGPDRAKLAAQAAALGVADDVLFTGELDDPESLLQHVFDVNVLASRSEALPLSLLEAAACGLPSVCSDAGGNPEAVEAGQTGFVVPVGDAGALAHRLGDLIDSAELRAAMGARARERAERHFGVERYAAEIQERMTALLHPRRSTSS